MIFLGEHDVFAACDNRDREPFMVHPDSSIMGGGQSCVDWMCGDSPRRKALYVVGRFVSLFFAVAPSPLLIFQLLKSRRTERYIDLPLLMVRRYRRSL